MARRRQDGADRGGRAAAKPLSPRRRRKSAERTDPAPPRARKDLERAAALFAAEAAYAGSMVRQALGDTEGMIAELRVSHEATPTYAPAILALGSVEYQIGNAGEGFRLFDSLLDLPATTKDLHEIIDLAGDFLIQRGLYQDGLRLYRRAAARFPRVSAFHEGVGCCAGNMGELEEAVAAARRALDLVPGDAKLMSDLGFALVEVGQLEEAHMTLQRAVAEDPGNELAAGNLRHCLAAMHKRERSGRRHARRQG